MKPVEKYSTRCERSSQMLDIAFWEDIFIWNEPEQRTKGLGKYRENILVAKVTTHTYNNKAR